MEWVKGVLFFVVKFSLFIYKVFVMLGWILVWCVLIRNELSLICGFEVEGLGVEFRLCSNYVWVCCV